MPQKTFDVKPCPKCGKSIRKRDKLCARCSGRNLPENRDKHALCGAIKRDGTPCRNYSGMRTDHKGWGHCWLHTGNTPSAKKAAAMAEAREQVAALGEPLPADTRPTQLLLWLTRVVGGHVQQLLTDPEAADLTTEVGRAKFRLTMDQIDRASRLAKQASEANAEQVEASVKAAEVVLMARMVREAAERAGLDPQQIARLSVELRAMADEARGDAPAPARSTVQPALAVAS